MKGPTEIKLTPIWIMKARDRAYGLKMRSQREKRPKKDKP